MKLNNKKVVFLLICIFILIHLYSCMTNSKNIKVTEDEMSLKTISYLKLTEEAVIQIEKYGVIDLLPTFIDENQALFTSEESNISILIDSELLGNGFRIGISKYDEIFIYYLFEDLQIHQFVIFRRNEKNGDDTIKWDGDVVIETDSYEIRRYQPRDIGTANPENEKMVLEKLYPLHPEQYIRSVFSTID